MSTLHRTGILSVAVLAGLFLAGGVALAGDYHAGADLNCSDCHVMHASYNGTYYDGSAPNPTGYTELLKGTKTALCLACHNGADSTAPDVVASGTAASPGSTVVTGYASAYGSSGGYFQNDATTVVNNAAHDLYAASALTAVQGDWQSGASGMACTDCHDAHGTSNYRNLLTNPDSGDAGTIDWTVGADVYVDPAASTLAERFDHDSIGYNAPNDTNEWCIDCHENIASDTASPWTKHPQDVAVSTLGDTGSHWTTGTGSGFGDTTVGGGSSGIPRIRFADPGTTFATVTSVATTNEVMCLSCHKPHGSKYDSSVVWPHYTTDNVDQTSACDQCHNKGA